jgi:hypothetical protein
MPIGLPRLNTLERSEWDAMQAQLEDQFKWHFQDPLAPKTVIILPGLSLDAEILTKLTGAIHYEERLLCLLLLLRMPKTNVVYLSSVPIDNEIVDYYLHLIPGVTNLHARKRLTMLNCYDASNRPLTEKVLGRPRLIQQIKNSIPNGHVAHLVAFNVTPLEEKLGLELGLPIYGCSSALSFWGTKSGSRELFRRAGIPLPKGIENLNSMKAVVEALNQMKAENPVLKRAAVKLNDGFSGDGNAIYYFKNQLEITEDKLPENLHIVAHDMDFSVFAQKFYEMGGVVEEYIEGNKKTSPSVQCRITPLREIDVISTHDQLLGGEDEQVYVGATFPAHEDYREEIGQMGKKVAQEMEKLGVLGRFGIDFISVWEEDKWKHFAIEINLRKGGTTHPFLMLQLLTNGMYDHQKGHYEMPNGQTRCYLATDNLVSEKLKKLTPADLIDIAICNGLHFDYTTQEGVLFHLIGAISQHGKLGVLCVGTNLERAQSLYDQTVQLLDLETQ